MSQGITRGDFLAGMIEALGFETYCEVGCKNGRTVSQLLKARPKLRAVAIDPWIGQPENALVDGRETYVDWDFANIERQFWELCEPYKDRLLMVRKTSEEAAKFLPGPFDLVFIDALHDEASVAQDIALWRRKVRPGGVLAGHDFQHKHRGVMRAVAEAFNLMDVGVGPDSVWFAKVGE